MSHKRQSVRRKSGICTNCGVYTRTLKKTQNGQLNCLRCYSLNIRLQRERKEFEKEMKEKLRDFTILLQKLNIPLSLLKSVIEKKDWFWDLELSTLESFALFKSQSDFRLTKKQIKQGRNGDDMSLLYPSAYIYFSTRQNKLIVNQVDWNKMFSLERQEEYWKLTKARQNYQCLFCEQEIQIGQNYHKFWKKVFTQLHLCCSCFEIYTDENNLLFIEENDIKPNKP